MRVKELMSSHVVTVGLDDRLEQVKELFESTRFHHLLVVEGETLYGVVSDRDLLRALSPFVGSSVESPRDLGTLNKRVHQVMSRKPITLGPEAQVADAMRLLLDQRISCIPVVDDQFKPIGILTWRDVLRAAKV